MPTNCWSVLDHFVGLALKGLNTKGLIFFLYQNTNKVDMNYDAINKVKIRYKSNSFVFISRQENDPFC